MKKTFYSVEQRSAGYEEHPKEIFYFTNLENAIEFLESLNPYLSYIKVGISSKKDVRDKKENEHWIERGFSVSEDMAQIIRPNPIDNINRVFVTPFPHTEYYTIKSLTCID